VYLGLKIQLEIRAHGLAISALVFPPLTEVFVDPTGDFDPSEMEADEPAVVLNHHATFRSSASVSSSC
jgi:hypothetical protein